MLILVGIDCVAWMERSDKIAGSDFGQPKADPQGGVQGWTPQIQESRIPALRRLHPGYMNMQSYYEGALAIDQE